MKVVQLRIQNFRGIRETTLHFPDRVVFVGDNNVGKSTIFEALDLALGHDRMSRHLRLMNTISISVSTAGKLTLQVVQESMALHTYGGMTLVPRNEVVLFAMARSPVIPVLSVSSISSDR